MGTLLRDLRYGLRMLAKNPGFTGVAILTLALGIGANAAIFSVINGLFLHPLGIADPGHLFAVRVKYDKLNLKSIVISAPDFRDVRDSTQIFSSAAASNEDSFNYVSPRGPERLAVSKVTWQWFSCFGARPLAGRIFSPEEDQPHTNHVAVLAYATWKDLFGGDSSILGKTIQLSRENYRVIGVMGQDFDWPSRTQLWVPLALPASEFVNDNYFNEALFVVARSRPEISAARAEGYVHLLTNRLIEASGRLGSSYPKDSGWGMFALPFTEYGSGDLRTPMLLLLGAVGFVLLIACANIGGLLIARASARSREFAVRVALGAQKWDLARQTLAETFLLTAAGTVAGVGAAYGGLGLLLRRMTGNLFSRVAIRMDGYVLWFGALLMVVTGMLLVLVPLAEVFSHRQYGVLKEEGRSVTSSRGRLRLRQLLAAGQMALALVLLVGAGLLLKSLGRIGKVNTGFDAEGLVTATVQLPDNEYKSDQKLAAFYEVLDEKLSALPGVRVASLAAPLPFTGYAPTSSFSIQGRASGPGDPGPHSGLAWITPEYFKTMGIGLLKGRLFTVDDRLGTQPVAIIDENLARQYWPNQDPIGQRLRRGTDSPWATIIGLVPHVMQSSLVGDSGKGICYYPMLQQPLPWTFVALKSNQSPAALARSIQAAVASLDPGQPVSAVKTMDEYVAGSLKPQRIAVSLLGTFSALALFLAALGLYGVISYGVSRRTQEIGVRMALGAESRQVWSMVMRQGLELAITGILAGALAALFVARLLTSQLYEVRSFDPSTFVLTSLALLAVALLACYIPARRATKVDPIVALRYE